MRANRDLIYPQIINQFPEVKIVIEKYVKFKVNLRYDSKELLNNFRKIPGFPNIFVIVW